MSIIYCHKNKVSGKCYVGQTTRTLEVRIGTNPAKSYRDNHKFSDDIIEYGWENFESSILEVVEDISTLNDRETFWINKLKQEGIQLYNKCLKGTSNARKTILSYNRVTEEDKSFITTLFEEGKSMKEIGEIVGVSPRSVKDVLIKLGYGIPTVGNLCSFDKEQRHIVNKFLVELRCPVCGKNFGRVHNIRQMLCSINCRTRYLTLSFQDRNKVKVIHDNQVKEYKSLRKKLKEEKDEYKLKRIETQAVVKENRKKVVSQIVDEIQERHKSKHTVNKRCWRKDKERCKQKLDLILNSGVDLMKFGYNTKLCEMFPELTKRTILFLLRKYNIPHFERVGSDSTNLNL